MRYYLRQQRAFTLIELLVVISIIALLVSILMPALNRAREAAQRVVCGTGLKSIGSAMFMYADEHDGWVTPAVSARLAYYDFTFDVGLDAYLHTVTPPFPELPQDVFIDRRSGIDGGIWQCPSDKVVRDPTDYFAWYRKPSARRSYTMNAMLVPNGSVPSTWGVSSKLDSITSGIIMFSEFWHPYNTIAELMGAVSYICGESYPGILYQHDLDGWPGHLGGVGNFLYTDYSVKCSNLKRAARQTHLDGVKQYWSSP